MAFAIIRGTGERVALVEGPSTNHYQVVKYYKYSMRVRILFDRPFYGMVFSKGHYSNVNCVHVPSGLGQTQVRYFCIAQLRIKRPQ